MTIVLKLLKERNAMKITEHKHVIALDTAEYPFTALELAQEIFWQAYLASYPVGMGVFKTVEDASKEDVWKQVTGQALHDYTAALAQGTNAAPYGDYVFGRMMKLAVGVEDSTVCLSNRTPNIEYQSWANRFPTYEMLLETAVTELQQAKGQPDAQKQA